MEFEAKEGVLGIVDCGLSLEPMLMTSGFMDQLLQDPRISFRAS